MSIHLPIQQINTVCKQEGITFLGLFGSYARNEETKKSDIDFLVEFDETKSLFELARVKHAFESLVLRKVDLVLKKNIKDRLKPYILKDLQTIYEKGN